MKRLAQESYKTYTSDLKNDEKVNKYIGNVTELLKYAERERLQEEATQRVGQSSGSTTLKVL